MFGPAEVEAAPRRRWFCQQKGRLDRTTDGYTDRCGVQRAELLDQVLRCRRAGEIALGQDNAVGKGGLFLRLRHAPDVALAIDGIDDRDQGLQMELAAEPSVGGKGLQNRTEIGRASC